MLHYPLYTERDEGLEKRQLNLTDYCIAQLACLKDKRILEVGCGNGLQSIYIANTYQPEETIAVDLIHENIELAKQHDQNGSRIIFLVDDAHKLENIPDQSIDTAICIESAFHYPDKDLFLSQMKRVLKPGGEFVIADILARKKKKRVILGRWKMKMNYHHWTIEEYERSFRGTDLTVEKSNNITRRVIHGYNGYMNWVNSKHCDTYMRYIMLQTFMFIQVNLNLILLKYRRYYYVFKGRRQELFLMN